MKRIITKKEVVTLFLFLFLLTFNKSNSIVTAGLDIPVLISPTEGSIINNNSPLFNWTDVDDADTYNLQLNDGTNSTVASIYVATSEYDYFELDDGDWTWYVRVNDSSGEWGTWSEMGSFTVDTTAPLIVGDDDVEMDLGETGLNISWTLSDLHPKNYTVYLDGSDFLFNSNWIDTPVVLLFLNGLTNGVHEFKIRVTDQAGNVAEDIIIVSVYPLIPEYGNMLFLLIVPIVIVGITVILKKR